MFALSVSSDIAQVQRLLEDRQQRQLPYAAARGLTETAKLVKAAEVHEMGDVFDRPTPWTLNSLFVKPATKQDLTAIVWLKDDRAGSGTPPDRYLNPEIKGGLRVPKAFERALQRVGALPPDYVAVPGAAAKLDQYGNLSRGQIVQLLSYFRTFDTAGFTANISDARRARLRRGTKSKVGFEYFVGRPGDGKLPLGIWQRFQLGHGTAIKPILIFIPQALYHAIYDFMFVAQRTFDREWPRQFAQALEQALATARLQ
jgi:hypothetical protein